jgi:hypothetical protein
MFGMLDYRAHKLYILLFCIPNLFLLLFAVFGLPLIYYSIGFSLADDIFYQIIISLISVFIIEIVWIICYPIIQNFFKYIFGLFVDIIPCDGRTKEQAQLVVINGEKAIRQIELSKHPQTWTPELINGFASDDWVQNLLFKENVVRRLNSIHDHYKDSPKDCPYSEWEIKEILADEKLKRGLIESFLCSSFRISILTYLFLLYLFVYQPFA